jgi:Predicted PP-loop superfamily ATPase
LADSALVGKTDIPEGNYDKEKMKQTIVPNRNMIMILVAAFLAIKNQIEHFWYAAHFGDHEIYPDCRPEFIDRMKAVLEICDYHKIKFEALFQNLSKSQIVEGGLSMNLDYSKTWICYEGKEKLCGKCSGCLERALSFEANNTEDLLNDI